MHEPVCSRTNAETTPKHDNTDGPEAAEETRPYTCTNPSVRERTPKQCQTPPAHMASKQLRKPVYFGSIQSRKRMSRQFANPPVTYKSLPSPGHSPTDNASMFMSCPCLLAAISPVSPHPVPALLLASCPCLLRNKHLHKLKHFLLDIFIRRVWGGRLPPRIVEKREADKSRKFR